MTHTGKAWLGRDLLEYPLWAVMLGLIGNAMMRATGVRECLICGVSAAIAAAGAVLVKKEHSVLRRCGCVDRRKHRYDRSGRRRWGDP